MPLPQKDSPPASRGRRWAAVRVLTAAVMRLLAGSLQR
jgi:hypothetical protein